MQDSQEVPAELVIQKLTQEIASLQVRLAAQTALTEILQAKLAGDKTEKTDSEGQVAETT